MSTRSSFGLGRLRRVLGMLRGRRQARGEAVIQHNSMALIRKPSRTPTRFHRSTDNDLEMITLFSTTISA